MKQKIDNDKMWASLMDSLHSSIIINDSYPSVDESVIIGALKDQGLQYNPETKEIESIEPETDKYVCIKKTDGFKVGHIYKCDGKLIRNDSGVAFTTGYWEDYFRPVTEEEIPPSEHKLVEAVVNEPVEQKPKFKVGDWVVSGDSNDIDCIRRISIRYYHFESGDCGLISDIDQDYHLWTIADAKDGDVLYYNNLLNHGSGIMIYMKDKSSECVINKYCSCNEFGFEIESYIVLNDGFVSPATKEQKDILFKAMHDAGYEWDAEKKKLRKIVEPEKEWVPQPGDVFRKKGTETPTYTLCSKREDGVSYGFCENREVGAAGGEITVFALESEYELVERQKPFDEFLEEEFNKQLSHQEVAKENAQELTEFEEEFLAIVDSWCHGDGRVYKDCNEQALKDARLLISIARKQLQPEFDAEIEQAYKNQDEVVYNRGYDKGFEDARKQFIEEACEYIRKHINDYYAEDFKKALEKGE